MKGGSPEGDRRRRRARPWRLLSLAERAAVCGDPRSRPFRYALFASSAIRARIVSMRSRWAVWRSGLVNPLSDGGVDRLWAAEAEGRGTACYRTVRPEALPMTLTAGNALEFRTPRLPATEHRRWGLGQRGNVEIGEDAAGMEIAGQQRVRHLPEEVAGGVVAHMDPPRCVRTWRRRYQRSVPRASAP